MKIETIKTPSYVVRSHVPEDLSAADREKILIDFCRTYLKYKEEGGVTNDEGIRGVLEVG